VRAAAALAQAAPPDSGDGRVSREPGYDGRCEQTLQALVVSRSGRTIGRTMARQRKQAVDVQPVRATGLTLAGPSLRGPMAIGALSVGAAAIGALAIGRLAIGRATIKRLTIDELEVRHLRVEELEVPTPGPASR
jgi:hypothetical protein